jgi:hypothetical protein
MSIDRDFYALLRAFKKLSRPLDQRIEDQRKKLAAKRGLDPGADPEQGPEQDRVPNDA